ncbi:MAG: hypothetical protein AAFZ15_04305 [Bacteroidota bacterium]
MTVNERLVEVLHDKKISALKFSEVAKLKARNLHNVTSGKTEFPRIDIIQAVARLFPDVNLRWLLIGEGEMYLSGGQLSTVKEISSHEKTKMLNALGKKELELMDKNEQLEYLAELLLKVGKLFMELPPFKEEGGEKLREIKRELDEGLAKVEGIT